MFDALVKLSTNVAGAYQRASEFGDLHLGDLHLIGINGLLFVMFFFTMCYVLFADKLLSSAHKDRLVNCSISFIFYVHYHIFITHYHHLYHDCLSLLS